MGAAGAAGAAGEHPQSARAADGVFQTQAVGVYPLLLALLTLGGYHVTVRVQRPFPWASV